MTAVQLREQWTMVLPVHVENEWPLEEVADLLAEMWADNDTIVSDVSVEFAINVRPTEEEAANGRISTLWVLGTAVRS